MAAPIQKKAWDHWNKMNPGQFWAAPMVGQSEQAYRMFVRAHGATCCHTPMIDASGYARSEEYRKEFGMQDVEPADKPLVVQLGGSNIDDLVASARLVEPWCDAIELNVGCPQRYVEIESVEIERRITIRSRV